MTSVLFVCTGNICRSPMAEAVFKHIVKKNGLEDKFGTIDSCGTTSYHSGDEADDRTLAVCRRQGIPCGSIARRLRDKDYQDFDYIFGMDTGHVRQLEAKKPRGSKASIHLFGEFDDNRSIDDPYYGGATGFEETYEQCVRYSRAFLKHLGLKSESL